MSEIPYARSHFFSYRLVVAFTVIMGIAGCNTQQPTARLDGAKESIDKPFNKPVANYQLPFRFEPNVGQINGSTEFIAQGLGYSLHLTKQEALLVLHSSNPTSEPTQNAIAESADSSRKKPSVVSMRYVGANPKVKLETQNILSGTVNYLVGNDASQWKTKIPVYAKVKYQNLYPGIDMVYYGNSGKLEYDFVIAPGITPNQIKLAYKGHEKLDINESGDLIFSLEDGLIRQAKPVIYQIMNGDKHYIDGGYKLNEKDQVEFQVAAYDKSLPLIIDPVLDYASYLGGRRLDLGTGIDTDESGFLYITGSTISVDFPTVAPLQENKNSLNDLFVTKLDPQDGSLIYSTYIGGQLFDEGHAISVNPAGEAYVTGYTLSGDFPVSTDALQSSKKRRSDAFVIKLAADGSALEYATFLGGRSFEMGTGIDVNKQGEVFVTGFTFSHDFPTLNPLQEKIHGRSDAFISRLTADGKALSYSTYLGGKKIDIAAAIAVNNADEASITGFTFSKDFPLINERQSEYKGKGDTFVTKLTAEGTNLEFSTYWGGKRWDQGKGIALDESGRSYITGYTWSNDFPTVKSFQSKRGGQGDGFISQFAEDGSTVGYSTYLGGKKDDQGFAIDVNSAGAAFVTGYTRSSDFPVLNPLQAERSKRSDVFITALKPKGEALIYSTYFGGQKEETGTAITVDNYGNTYIIGETISTDFPTLNPLQPQLAGSSDVFIAHISLLPTSLVFDNPVDGADLTETSPIFAISFQAGESPPDLDSFQLLINGVDVTSGTIVTETGATYTAASLPGGANSAVATITDGSGIVQTASISFNVNIDAEGFRAIADCAPTNGAAPLAVRYRSRGEFEGGSIVRYRWDFQGDGTFDTSDSVARDYNFTFTQSGTFNAVLEVTNNLGTTTTDTCPIIVAGNAPIAVANVTPSNGPVPLDVNLTCTGTDPDGTIELYEWDFEGDGTFDFSSPTSGNTTHTYTETGTFRAVCRLTDNEGKTTEARTTASIIRPAPLGSPSVEASASPAPGNGPLTVSFNGTATDDGTLVLWEWDFDGDGTFDFSSPDSPATSFTYNNGGIFAPALRVTDNEGKIGIDTVEVIVNLSASLSVSPDTFNPEASEAGTINTTLSVGAPARLVIKDQSGNVVRILVDETRAAGSYSDNWDGLDDDGNLVPEGPYFAVLEYDFSGEVRTIDLTNTTGGARSSPPRTGIPSSFAPFAGQPLTIDFTLNRAAEVLAFIGRFNVDTRLVTFLNRQPLGKGTHQLTWNGENAEGQLIHPPSGDRFLFGVFAFTLPDNALYVRSGATVSGLSVGPPIFDPSGYVDDQGTPEQSEIIFSLSKAVSAELIVSDATTGTIVTTRNYPDLVVGENTVLWDGRDDNGIYVAPGRYRLGIAAIDNTGYKSLRVYAVQRVYY